jgi:hypothetical protein
MFTTHYVYVKTPPKTLTLCWHTVGLLISWNFKAVVTQVSLVRSYVMQDNKFVPTFPPEQYLVTMKTGEALPCETLEENYYLFGVR